MSLADKPIASEYPIRGTTPEEGFEIWWSEHYNDDANYEDAFMAGVNWMRRQYKNPNLLYKSEALAELLYRQQKPTIKITSQVVKDNDGNIVHNLKLCKNKEGKHGWYDTVTEKFIEFKFGEGEIIEHI